MVPRLALARGARPPILTLLCCAPLVVAGCAGAPTPGFRAPSEQEEPAPSPRPLTYVAIGASDAVGVGSRNPEAEGWVPRLAAALGPDTRLVNLGVSGSTVAQALDDQLGPAVDAGPDLVTVWLVVNDLNAGVPLDRYAADLDRLLAGLEPTGARVLVGNVPDLARVAAYTGADPELLGAAVDRWNAAIADVAERHAAQLVDLHAHWRELDEHPEYVSGDGFHPSSEGYARLAEIFADAYAGRR